MECSCWLWIALFVIALLLSLNYYLKAVMWHANGPIMRGKTVIVTGANTGIGFGAALELAKYGAKVILACRDLSKAAKARQEIVDQLKHADGQEHSDIEQRVVIEELDLANFDSIRAFASRMEKLERLDVLINNAGVGFMRERRLTKDGLEMTMGTNHFGHFLLTNLLLDLLKKSEPSRIVVVSSVAYKFGTVNFDNLNSELSHGWFKAYANSKLANILFTRELARQLDGSGVVINAMHPGTVSSDFARSEFPVSVLVWLKKLRFFVRSPVEGAQTIVYLAASQMPEVQESGNYFVDCKVERLKSNALDQVVAKKLWEVSERLTKLA